MDKTHMKPPHIYSASYDDPLLAELYDATETATDDVELLRRLIGCRGPLNVLEVFSGTGRVLIPLALDGHRVTGIEIAPAMAARCTEKIARLGDEVQSRVFIEIKDALTSDWGTGFDLVALGSNALYELPQPEMQRRLIERAYQALGPGGRLFIDNDDYKGDWGSGPFGVERTVFEGTGADGRYGRWTMESLRFDENRGVLNMKRRWRTRTATGEESHSEYHGSKHPVTADEIREWLDAHGFLTLEAFGDRSGNPYTSDSQRAIFWAQKR